MYSSRRRGLSPASYCASSSTALDETRRSSATRQVLQCCSKQVLETDERRAFRPAGRRLHHPIQHLLYCVSMVAEIGERRHDILLHRIGCARDLPFDAFGSFEGLRESIAQLDDDSFGRFLTDAGNA